MTGAWARIYGVELGGAVLVRPDGYVAWRHQAADCEAEARLGDALRRVLAR